MKFDRKTAKEHFDKYGYYRLDISEIMQGFKEDVIFDRPNSFYGQMPDVEQNIPIEDCFSINEEKLAVLDDLTERLNKFFSPEDLKIIFVQWWTSAGVDVEQWHNDKHTLRDYGQEVNANLNIYLDDVPGEDEGVVYYRNIDDKENTVVSTKPSRYTAVFFNQTGQFEHYVTPTKARRRLIGFAAIL